MKATLKRRARILRVRRIEHLEVAAAAARADSLVVELDARAAQLALLGAGLRPGAGAMTAATLAAAGELATRLRDAGDQLAVAQDDAREAAAARDAERVDARIAVESAERLVERARADLAAWNEQRMAALAKPRRRAPAEDVR